ncbi:hypothetical protein T492DRAFT_1024201 [Pavlovales sp. CCMP2436]|nr:hypothetical protein T492DRAFT_1024201 [Pavlovales sp. CCMP2436]
MDEVEAEFSSIYAKCVQLRLITPELDPRPAFDRLYAAKVCGGPAAGARHVRARSPSEEPADDAVIGAVSLPLLDRAASGPSGHERGAGWSDDDSEEPAKPTDEEDGEASLLPEPPTLGGWFVNRRQTLGEDTTRDGWPAQGEAAAAQPRKVPL